MKMIKLEKLISKFSKEIGVDKSKLLLILLGENKNDGRPKSNHDLHRGIDSFNTGIAAKIAYNNM